MSHRNETTVEIPPLNLYPVADRYQGEPSPIHLQTQKKKSLGSRTHWLAATTDMTRPPSRVYPPTGLTAPLQEPQVHCQDVPYQASPLHGRGAACVPMTADDDFVVSPDVVCEAKMRTGLFVVLG